MKAILIRLADDGKQTLGQLLVFDGLIKIFECKTLELPYLDNQKQISCIPVGTYIVKKHTSPTFGKVFYVSGVPNRSEILIHKGNFNKDTKGCILIGSGFGDINKDGTTDIVNSNKTVEDMLKVMPDEFKMTII